MDEIEINIGPKDHFQLLDLSETVAKFCANGIAFLVGKALMHLHAKGPVGRQSPQGLQPLDLGCWSGVNCLSPLFLLKNHLSNALCYRDLCGAMIVDVNREMIGQCYDMIYRQEHGSTILPIDVPESVKQPAINFTFVEGFPRRRLDI